MNTEWQKTFQSRMRHFEERRPPQPGEVPVSIKMRVPSGCFHREHSPQAYALIDRELMSFASGPAFEFEEHESGPELLVYVALATSGITLAKSIIDLVTAIIKARSEGVKKGDGPSSPIELIVRRTGQGQEFREEVVLRLDPDDPVSGKMVGECLNEALKGIIRADAERQKPGSPPPSQIDHKRRGHNRS
jgi:hypothetical protein